MTTAIEAKHTELQNRGLNLGRPLGPEKSTRKYGGRFVEYEYGVIFWRADLGAHEVHGAIYARLKELDLDYSYLGLPQTDELATPDGQGRFNHFEKGSIYWHPDLGAHNISGALREKWAQMSWERGPLGYPVAHEMHTEQSLSCQFQGGQLLAHKQPQTFNAFFQNMALLGVDLPFSDLHAIYKGVDRKASIQALIDFVRTSSVPFDVVGLCEMFVNDERAEVFHALSELFPHRLQGPDEHDLEEDGGLLLLSRHPIVASSATIYRQATNEDALANKGCLHAQIQKGNTRYDVFVTHLQSQDSGGFPRTVSQSRHLFSFVEAERDLHHPTLVMGDFNLNGLNPEQLAIVQGNLPGYEDLWLYHRLPARNRRGITSDKVSGFTHPLSPRDPQRFQQGSRLDYFLAKPGLSLFPEHGYTNPVLIQHEDRELDISDHYGMETRQLALWSVNAVLAKSDLQALKVSFESFHCLDTTSGPGSDEVYFFLKLRVDRGREVQLRTPTKEHVDAGEIHQYAKPLSLQIAPPAELLELQISGQEHDTWSADDFLGRSTRQLTRNELVQMKAQRVQIRMPRLRGDGGEYVVTLRLEVQ